MDISRLSVSAEFSHLVVGTSELGTTTDHVIRPTGLYDVIDFGFVFI